MAKRATKSQSQKEQRNADNIANLVFDQNAEGRSGQFGLFAVSLLILSALQFFDAASPSSIAALGGQIVGGSKLPGADVFMPTIIWLLCAFVAPFALLGAVGSSVIFFDREAQELRWKKSFLGLPLPGLRIPFDRIVRISTAKVGAMIQHNPASGPAHTRLSHEEWMTVQVLIEDKKKPLVIWSGDKLPPGLSAKSISKKLGWRYDKFHRGAVPPGRPAS